MAGRQPVGHRPAGRRQGHPLPGDDRGDLGQAVAQLRVHGAAADAAARAVGRLVEDQRDQVGARPDDARVQAEAGDAGQQQVARQRRRGEGGVAGLGHVEEAEDVAGERDLPGVGGADALQLDAGRERARLGLRRRPGGEGGDLLLGFDRLRDRRTVVHVGLDRWAGVDVSLQQLAIEPCVQGGRPLRSAAVRAAADPVIPLADPQLVAGAAAALVEPVHRSDPCRLVVDAVDEEDVALVGLRLRDRIAFGVPLREAAEEVAVGARVQRRVEELAARVLDPALAEVVARGGAGHRIGQARRQVGVGCQRRVAEQRPVELVVPRHSGLELVVVHARQAGAGDDRDETLGLQLGRDRRRRADV